MWHEPLKLHFHDSEAKIKVFEQNTDIIKFWLFLALLQKHI